MSRPAPSGEDWDRDEARLGAWAIPVRWEREEIMGALMPFRMTEITGAACGEREPLIAGGPIEGMTRDATHDLDGHPPEPLDWWEGGPGTEAQQAIYAQGQAEKAKRDWTLQAVWEYQQERDRELAAAERTIQRLEAAFGATDDRIAQGLETELHDVRLANERLEAKIQALKDSEEPEDTSGLA